MAAILNNQRIALNTDILSLALYSYGCFTTFAVTHGHVKGFNDHMQRLLRDARALFGTAPDNNDIQHNIETFLHLNSDANPIIVRVTLFPNDFSFAAPEHIDSLNILVTGRAQHLPAENPIRLSRIDATRPFAGHKTTNMLACLNARATARKNGFDDALMVNRNIVTEGATWNIFFGVENHLTTPSLDSGILPGVTRGLILKHAQEFGFSVSEEKINIGDIDTYTYCFATNATAGITPIGVIDNTEYEPHCSQLANLKKGYSRVREAPIFQQRNP